MIKLTVIVLNLIVLVMYTLFIWFFDYSNLMIKSHTEILEIVYSPDNKYIMVLEETDSSTHEETDVFVGRNIDFGMLGHYMPRRLKYFGNSGERPVIYFVDASFIRIDEEMIEIKGRDYIDDYH